MGRLYIPLLSISFILVGFTAAIYRTSSILEPMLEKKVGSLSMRGTIENVQSTPFGERLFLKDVSYKDITLWDPSRTVPPLPKRIRLTLRLKDLPPYHAGQVISTRGMIGPVTSPVLPGSFDFRRAAYFRQFSATAYGFTVPEIIEDRGNTSFFLWLTNLRHTLTKRLHTILPGQKGAIASALITGEKGTIAPSVREAFANAGIAHILAISGLHLSLIAGTIFLIIRVGLALIPIVSLRFKTKKGAAIVALVGSFCYLLLSGMGPPAQRSFMMISIVMLAILLDRIALSMRSVAIAAIVILMLRPENLLSPSFQLSFAAVIALIALYEGNRVKLLHWSTNAHLFKKGAFYLFGIIITSLVATMATTPYSLYTFHRFTLQSLPANIVGIPLTGFWILPLGLIGVLLMPVGLEEWPLRLMGLGISYLITVATIVSQWPGAVMKVQAFPLSYLILFTSGALWLCLWQKPWRYWGIVPMVLAFTMPLFQTQPDILISGDGKVVSVLHGDTLHGSTDRSSLFTQALWMERMGALSNQLWPYEKNATSPLSCKPMGCTYKKDSQTIAFIKDPENIRYYCPWASLIISEAPLFWHKSLCKRMGKHLGNHMGTNPKIIDRFDIWWHGAHAIWINNDKIIIKTVGQDQGKRPWSLHYDRYRKKS